MSSVANQANVLNHLHVFTYLVLAYFSTYKSIYLPHLTHFLSSTLPIGPSSYLFSYMLSYEICEEGTQKRLGSVGAGTGAGSLAGFLQYQ